MLKQVIDAWEVLDSPKASGQLVAEMVERTAGGGGDVAVSVRRVAGKDGGGTDFLVARFPGTGGRTAGGSAPTLGILGQLGGVGARPAKVGLVSDGDGAVVAVAVALKLAAMVAVGDRLSGDVIVTTHICPGAPTVPHEPVPFMGSPVGTATANRYQVLPEMDALLSVDTTRGNRILNHRGFAITPTAKEGYLLRVSEDLLTLMQNVTGRPPVVLPVTTQDLTPYGNGIYHLNSIMQPATATAAPVVGVALTAETAVPGSATGASQFADIEAAARFCLEVAKEFTGGKARFYDPDEYARLLELYGPLRQLMVGGEHLDE